MEVTVKSSPALCYDEFEPFCSWKREEGQDILIAKLPDFKKEQLKVLVTTTSGILKIFGERPVDSRRSGILNIFCDRQVDSTKRSKFYKEVKLPKECNINEIHAFFIKGLLHIVMPKKTTAALPCKETTRSETMQVTISNVCEAQPDISASMVQSLLKEVVAVTVAVAVVSSALASYFMCKVKPMVFDDEFFVKVLS